MSRLIDVDELLKKQTILNEYDEGGWDWPVSVVLVEDIKSAPTINPDDLRPRGRWINIRKWWQGGSLWKKCSECGKLDYKSNFCPNCGARMEGEP